MKNPELNLRRSKISLETIRNKSTLENRKEKTMSLWKLQNRKNFIAQSSTPLKTKQKLSEDPWGASRSRETHRYARRRDSKNRKFTHQGLNKDSSSLFSASPACDPTEIKA